MLLCTIWQELLVLFMERSICDKKDRKRTIVPSVDVPSGTPHLLKPVVSSSQMLASQRALTETFHSYLRLSTRNQHFLGTVGQQRTSPREVLLKFECSDAVRSR